MSFRRAYYRMSQFKKSSNPNITKKSTKENTVFNFIVYFFQAKAFSFFFETHKKGFNK